MLGFLPRGLAEEKVRSAIEADDKEARALLMSSAHAAHAAPCSCNGVKERAPSSRQNPLTRSYRALRRTHHPALARVLSDHYRMPIGWDDPIPRLAATWVEYLGLRAPFDRNLIVALLQDITIEKNARMIKRGGDSLSERR